MCVSLYACKQREDTLAASGVCEREIGIEGVGIAVFRRFSEIIQRWLSEHTCMSSREHICHVCCSISPLVLLCGWQVPPPKLWVPDCLCILVSLKCTHEQKCHFGLPALTKWNRQAETSCYLLRLHILFQVSACVCALGVPSQSFLKKH